MNDQLQGRTSANDDHQADVAAERLEFANLEARALNAVAAFAAAAARRVDKEKAARIGAEVARDAVLDERDHLRAERDRLGGALEATLDQLDDEQAARRAAERSCHEQKVRADELQLEVRKTQREADQRIAELERQLSALRERAA